MKTLLLKTVNEHDCSFKVIHTDKFEITNKCVYYNCGGRNRVLKSDLLLFFGTQHNTTSREHKKIENHFINIKDDYLIKCTNGDVISFDYNLKEWIVNDDEIITGEEVAEVVKDILSDTSIQINGKAV